MQRAHKIRLNPTAEQQVYFRKACGTARYAFNWGLTEVQRALDEGRQLESTLDLKKRFNAIKGAQFPLVYQVTKCATEGAFVNLVRDAAHFRASHHEPRNARRVAVA